MPCVATHAGYCACRLCCAAFYRSAFVVPTVLLLTTILFQAIWYYVRGGVLKCCLKIPCITKPIGCCCGGMLEEAKTYAHDRSIRYRQTFTEYLRTHSGVTLIVIFFAYYQAFAKAATGMLMCVDAPTGDKRWVLDVRLPCPAAAGYYPKAGWAVGAILLGVAMMVVCIGIPSYFACVLLYRVVCIREVKRVTSAPSSRSKDPATTLAAWLTFRYAGYKASEAEAEAWTRKTWAEKLWHPLRNFHNIADQLRLAAVMCWDSVLDVFRFMLVLVSMCVMLHELHQLLLVAALLGCYLVAMLVVQPWKSRATHKLQVTGLFVLVLSCAGIIAWSVDDAGSFYASAAYRNVIPWVVLSLNLCYVVGASFALVYCTVRALRGDGSKKAAGKGDTDQRTSKKGAALLPQTTAPVEVRCFKF